MLLINFHNIAFHCILSTANHITPTSIKPVAIRHKKNFISSTHTSDRCHVLLSNTQILLVTNANNTAKNHASTVDGTFCIESTW